MTAVCRPRKGKPGRLSSALALLAVCAASSAAAQQPGKVTLTLGLNPAVRLQHVLPAFGGMLLGFDGGEWGGGLVFVSEDGLTRQIFDDNVDGLARIGTRAFLFAGHGHGSSNDGSIMEVKPGSLGFVDVKKSIALTGQPSMVRQVDARTVTFLVFTGAFDGAQPVYRCKAFDGNAISDSKRCAKAPE